MHTDLLARSLRDRGHDVTLFASTASQPADGLEAICDATAMVGIGLEEADDVVFFKEHHAYLSLMMELRRRDFDVIHNNSLHYLPVVLADTLPMPVVTTLHTPPFCWLESGIRLGRANSSTFVAVSQSIHRSWAHVASIKRVISNGIDLQRFAYRAHADQQPYLVWFGRIVPEKGLHLAIDAANMLDMELRIAGPVLDDEYYLIRIRPQLSQRIRHLGHLDHRALSAVVAGARAFVCSPQWEEPYGLVVAEALACGVPVASFARGAIPEILDRSCGVLATPDDAASLAHAAHDAQRLHRRDCRHRAEAFCDARHMVDSYEALYRQLTARRPGKAAEPIQILAAADRTIDPAPLSAQDVLAEAQP